MKKKYSRMLKTFYVTLATISAVACIIIAALFTNFGRRIFLSGVTSYLRLTGTTCEIRGLNKDCSKIEKIYIKSANNSAFSFSGISIKRNALFAKANIQIEEFIFKNGNNSKSEGKLKGYFSLIGFFRTFISDLRLKKGVLSFSGEKYFINDAKYSSDGIDDALYCSFKNGGFFKCSLRLLDFGYIEARAFFNGVSGLNGEAEVKKLNRTQAEYKLFIKANAGDFFINSEGEIDDLAKEIRADKLIVKYNRKTYNLSGKIFIEDGSVSLETQICLDAFAKDLPAELRKNFENTVAKLNVQYFFNNKAKSKISADFNKNGKSIGKIFGALQSDSLSINGNLDWINIYGYRLKNLECKIHNWKNTTAVIKGDGFDLTLAGENGLWKMFFNAEGFGSITSDDLLSNTANVSFKFNRLDFWNKIVPISGDAVGNVSYNKKVIKAVCKGNKLIFKNGELLNYSARVDDKNISLASKNARFFSSNLREFFLNVINNKFELKGKINNNSLLIAKGKIAESYKKISLDKCLLSSDGIRCEVKVCELDFEKMNHNFICEVSNNKTRKSGQMKFQIGDKATKIEFASFYPGLFSKVLGVYAPKCRLDGSIKLNHAGDAISGKGYVSISELLSKRTSLELNATFLEKGIQLNGIMKNAENTLSGDIFFPVSLKKNWNIVKNFGATPLKGRIFGTARLEHLFELSDRADARGLFNCDLKISGSLSNPCINGIGRLQNAYFVIGDVFLRKGDILLKCFGRDIEASRAEFSDSHGKKLTAAGGGQFFFDGLMPNIKTNLALNCDNFTLFDSEDLNIAVSGNGKITGPINDLLISGDVDITKCNVQNVETDSGDQSDGIIIENEINVPKKQSISKEAEKDFCRYDITMRCPKIFVIGDAYKMTFGGDLRLVSHERVAALVGSLRLIKGRLNLFDKRMIMRKGRAEFFEQYPFDPKLNILCQNNFGNMTVRLKIKNVPEKGVSFRLFSRPSYSQGVIVSNMLFGKELKYLNVSEAAQFAQAMSSLKRSGGHIFSILNTFKKSGVIDSISFTDSNNATSSLNTNAQTSESQGIGVGAGKYVKDNLFISINKNTDGGASFDIDYSLTPQISVKANTNAEFGVGWKYKY